MEQSYTPGPPYGGQAPMGPPPKNWLVESILVTLFCCLPLGIVGIINASKVNSSLAVGDYAGAQAASLEAGKWVKYGLIAGIVVGVLYAVLVMVMGVGGAMLGGMRGGQ